jgi:hypothetical protein
VVSAAHHRSRCSAAHLLGRMLEADSISSISDELRNLVESEWLVLAHKLPPKEPQK